MNYPQTIFLNLTTLQTCAGKTKTLYKVEIPVFREFQLNIIMNCVIQNFNRTNAKLNINLSEQTLENNKVQIPMYTRDGF